jgi:hypothetical protein
VAWHSSGDITRHFCEACYPEAEAQRVASYQPKQKPLPTIDVEHITAQDYFDFSVKAHANGEDAPVFRYVSQELKRFPATRERLAIEMLTMAWESIEKGNPAWNLIGLGSLCNSLPGAKPSAFVDLLENIFLRSVEWMAESATARPDHPLGFDITTAARALRRADQARYSALMESLKSRPSPEVLSVLDYLEHHMAELDKWVHKRRRCKE